MALNKSLKKRGILFFITENDGVVNDELIKYGAEELITTGVIRKEIDEVIALVKTSPTSRQ